MTKNLKLLALAIAVFAVATQSYARDLVTAGNVKIRNAIILAEVNKPDFGTIERPTAGTVDVIVSVAGATTGTTAVFIDSSSVTAGNYTIQGSAIDTISITAVDNATTTGLSFTALVGKYGASATSLDLLAGVASKPAPTASGTALVVGGTLNVDHAVVEGNYAPGFTITVNYD